MATFVRRDKKALRTNSLLGPDSYSPDRALEDVTFDESGELLPFDIQASLLLAVRVLLFRVGHATQFMLFAAHVCTAEDCLLASPPQNR